MHSDASSSPADALLYQIFSNISKGTHPTCPTHRPSPLTHVLRTRYSSLLKPAVAKAWKGRTRGDGNSETSEHEGVGPSPAFCKKVLEGVFDAFSEDDWEKIRQEINAEWGSQTEKYLEEIMELYGGHLAEGLVYSLPNTLKPLLSTLKVLTGLSFTLWVGGSLGEGIGLINISSEFERLRAPLVVSPTQEDIFTQMAEEWIGEVQDAFLERCIAPAETTIINASRSPVNKKTSLNGGLNTSDEQVEQVKATELPRLTTPTDPYRPLPAVPGGTRKILTERGMKASGPARKRKTLLDGSPPPRTSPNKKQRTGLTTASTPTSPSTVSRDSTQSLAINRSLNPTSKKGNGHSVVMSTSNAASNNEISTPSSSVDVPLINPQALNRPAQAAAKLIHPIRQCSSGPYPPPLTLASIKATMKNIPSSIKWLSEIIPGIINIDIGPQYLHIVKCLIELETLHTFNKDNDNGLRLSRTNRPEEVKMWINRGRKCSYKVKITNLSLYTTSWWQWWKNNQPAWREYNNAGIPISTVPEGKVEDWSHLLVPGLNGFLSVVASLYWWGCTVAAGKGKAKEDGMGWDEAARDCGWVMERLILVAKQKSNPRSAEVERLSPAF